MSVLAWLEQLRRLWQAGWQFVRDQVIAIWSHIEGTAPRPASSRRTRTPSLVIGRDTVLVIGPQNCVTVTPPPRPIWDDRGWTVRPHARGNVYTGEYRVRTATMAQPRRFAGCIVQPPWPGTIIAYVADPPPELRRHQKGACFQLTQPPWFLVHWQQPATTVDDALLYVERVLAEALERT